jgi:pyrroloquinoline quinone biosynthesis protein B
MTPILADACRDADAVFFDGTLYDDEEMIRANEGTKTGRRMGHMPMTGEGSSVEAFRALTPKRKFFLHINNTNPAARHGSAARAGLAAAGWEIADDGMEIVL